MIQSLLYTSVKTKKDKQNVPGSNVARNKATSVTALELVTLLSLPTSDCDRICLAVAEERLRLRELEVLLLL